MCRHGRIHVLVGALRRFGAFGVHKRWCVRIGGHRYIIAGVLCPFWRCDAVGLASAFGFTETGAVDVAFRVIDSLVPDPVDNAVDFGESVPDVTAFSLMAKGILEFAYAYPHYFHWWWLAPSHVRPIQLVALVYHVGGDEAYGVSLPLFAGFVDGVIPGDIGPSFDMVLVRHRVPSAFLDCTPRRF